MDKRIKEHKEFIETEIEKAQNFEHIDSISRYHNSMMINFHKERSAHLIITLFFALYSLIFITLYIFSQIFILLIPCGLCFTLLFFYVFHYYALENGIQSLYEIEKKIYEKSNSLTSLYLER